MMSLNPLLKAIIEHNNREFVAIRNFANGDDDAYEVARDGADFLRAGFALTPSVVSAVAAIAADMWPDKPEGLRPFLDNLKAVLAALDR